MTYLYASFGVVFLCAAVIGLFSLAAGTRGEPLEIFADFVMLVLLAAAGVLLLVLP